MNPNHLLYSVPSVKLLVLLYCEEVVFSMIVEIHYYNPSLSGLFTWRLYRTQPVLCCEFQSGSLTIFRKASKSPTIAVFETIHIIATITPNHSLNILPLQPLQKTLWWFMWYNHPFII